MRAKVLNWVPLAAVATLACLVAVLFGTPGCKSQSAPDANSAQRSSSRSLTDVANGLGIGIGRNDASVLQAQPPAASAMRGEKDVEGIPGLGGRSGGSGGETMPATDMDGWAVVTSSLSLFNHPPYVVDLLIGFGLAIVMALALTTMPKSLVPRDPVAAVEERNGGLIVALVGCLAAELVQSSEQLALGAEIALVLFGIGGLIRFRTVFGDPRRTGLMILITILGLCCGVSQYALAVLAFVVIWFVRYFLLSNMTLVVQVRPRKAADMEQVRTAATTIVANRGVTVRNSSVRRGGRTLELHASCRGALDEEDLRQALEDALPGARIRVSAS